MSTAKRKAGDNQEPIPYTVKRGDTPVDLSAATSVAVYIEAPDGTMDVSGAAATITSATDGEVEYTPADTELTTEGTHLAEWEVTWSTAVVERFPKQGYQHVEVDATL